YGLKIYNMSNPENPLLIGSTDLPGIYHDLYVDVERKLAYLADLEDGLEILDITILSNPIHVGNYSVGEQNARYIYALNNLLFLANYETGLEIFNVSDPSNPTKIGGYEITDGCILEHVSDNIAYLSSGGMELIILNVTNPFQPVKLGVYRDDEPVRAFYVDTEENLAIINSLDSIKIIDLSDPTNPGFLGENYEVKPSYTFGIFKENDLAYIGEFEDGLAIINVSNPERPFLLHKYTDDGGVGWVFSEDTIVYVGIVYSRVRILRISVSKSTESTTTESTSPSFELLIVLVNFIVYCGIKKYRHRKKFKFNIND
ncbi:MAG: LVIVD repeat-containing protein, partial [Candidatus Hodarchaeota archaeon]